MQLMNSLAEVQGWAAEQSSDSSWVYRWVYTGFKGTPTKRFESRKVVSAEQGWLLTWGQSDSGCVCFLNRAYTVCVKVQT